MKKLLSFLLITVFVLVLTACGGGGGGGGGVSSSPSAGSPAGSTVSYSPAYTYNVPADKTSSDAYLIRRSVSVGILPTPGATSYASVAVENPVTETSFACKRFPHNTDEWPLPESDFVTTNRFLASIQPKNYVVYGSEDDNANHSNSTENFWVITDFTTNSGATRTFKLTNIGQHCRVWYDITNPNNLSATDLTNIQNKLDAMFEVETALCGSMVPTHNNYLSINLNTKLEIVIYEMEHSPQYTLCGYFSPKDLYPNEPNSNKAPIIYVSSYNISPETYSTVSHEFNHLLNYVKKVLNNNKRNMETWYTELLSNTIEEVLEVFNGATDIAYSPRKMLPIFLCSYNYGLCWKQNMPSYANVYAFGAWLLRNYGGSALFHEIATNEYVNEESIEMAVRSKGYNETFDSLRKKFAESLIYITDSGKPNFNKSVSENYYYKNNMFVTINMPAINLNSNQFQLTSSASEGLATILADCTAGHPYVGPVIFNPEYHFSNLNNSYPETRILDYGFEIQKLGSGLSQIEIPSSYYGSFEVVYK